MIEGELTIRCTCSTRYVCGQPVGHDRDQGCVMHSNEPWAKAEREAFFAAADAMRAAGERLRTDAGPEPVWHRYTPTRLPAFGDVVRLVGCESDHIGVVVCWTVGGASVVWRGGGLRAVGAYSAGSLEWRSAAPQDRGGR